MKYNLLVSFVVFISVLVQEISANSIEDDLSGFIEETSPSESAMTEALGEEGDLNGFMDEEVLEGFDDDPLPVQSKEEGFSEEKSDHTLSGDIAFKTSIGYQKHEVDGSDYSGFNQAQTALYIQYDSRLSDDWKARISADGFYDAIYDLRSNEDYRNTVKDDYRTQLRLDDTYIQGRLSSNLDIKVGRQVVVWGKSDNIRVTDVINPLDNRLPGMIDIEDLRLSVGMAKLDYYLKQWNVSAMAIAENRIMIEATPRGEFFPVDSIFSVPGGVVDPFPPLRTPSSSLENMQYAFALNGIFAGWDLSFYAADVLDQKWHFKELPVPGVPLSSRTVSKLKMLGSAFNLAYGSWLLKAEVAHLDGVKYNTTLDDKRRLDTLIGLEYMGITDSTISLEVANRHIFDHEGQMQNQADFVDKNEMQSALRITHSYANDTLNTTALITLFGSSLENGGFFRLWSEYDLMDAVSLNVGIVDYIGGDKPLSEAIKDNDRIFADIKYSF